MTASAQPTITPTRSGHLQKVPQDHDLISFGGLGWPFGGELVVTRECTVLKETFNCLISSST